MTRGRTWLSRSWWAVAPPFALLVVRLAVDRACADPYNLVPTLAARPLIAWTMAGVYVLAHLWLLGAYLDSARATTLLLPAPGAVRSLWGRERWKIWVLLAAMAVEYAPLLVFSAARGACA